MTTSGNLFSEIRTATASTETFADVLARPGLRIERIISRGQVSPPGFWYDQPDGEWVLVLAGEARLIIEGDAQARELKPGDWIDLPPHCRHRVEWTPTDRETVWLAVHYQGLVGGTGIEPVTPAV